MQMIWAQTLQLADQSDVGLGKCCGGLRGGLGLGRGVIELQSDLDAYFI